MRASRLVSVLMLLQARGRVTAQDLADELEVSVRTVYRDVGALQAAGVPVVGDPGHDGGYRLLDGYRTRLTGLTADEAGALFLAGLPGPAAELGLADVTAAARRKLAAALPPDLRGHADRSAARFHLDAPEWYGDAVGTPWLGDLVGALWTDRRVRVRYRRWAEPREVDRLLDPYGLVLKAGTWYLVAAAGPAVRTYRVAHVQALDVLDETFERPAGFDLAGWWRASLADFDARRFTGEATVRFTPAALDRLTDLLPPDLCHAITASAGRPDPDGRVDAVLPVESARSTLVRLLPFGADVEVLAPPGLRAEFAATAAALARTYGVTTRPGSAV